MELYIIGGFIIEAIVETIKLLFQDGKFNRTKALALFTGIMFCIVFKLDLLAKLGLTTDILMISYVLTGILLSRGSNFINQLLEKLTGKKMIE